MPSTITNHVGGSSFETGVQAKQTSVTVGITETTPPGDSVEISSPGASPNNPPSTPPRTTYKPPSVGNRFQFAIQNGMFDASRRYTPLTTRFAPIATATYQARENLEQQVSQMSGQNGVYSAMFDLGYQAAQPNPSQVDSHVEARNELTRMADQNLSLLNSL